MGFIDLYIKINLKIVRLPKKPSPNLNHYMFQDLMMSLIQAWWSIAGTKKACGYIYSILLLWLFLISPEEKEESF